MREERYLSRPVLNLCRALRAVNPKAWHQYFVEDGPGVKVGHVDWETGHLREYRLVGLKKVDGRVFLEAESGSGGRLLLEPSECVPGQILGQGVSVERALAVPQVFARASRVLAALPERVSVLAQDAYGRAVDLALRARDAFQGYLARGEEAARAAGQAVRERAGFGVEAVSGAGRSVREGAERVLARAVAGAVGAVRRPLERVVGQLARAEERWSVCLRQVPAGSEVAQEAAEEGMAERVGSSALVPAVERAGEVLVPGMEGFCPVSEETLDAMGPEAGRLSGGVLEYGPAVGRMCLGEKGISRQAELEI